MRLVELCYACLLPLPKRFVLALGSSGLVRVHDRVACRHGRHRVKEFTREDERIRSGSTGYTGKHPEAPR